MNVLEQYDAKSGKWAEILLNSVKMTLPGLAAAGFKKGEDVYKRQVLDMMDFEGIEKVRERVQQNGMESTEKLVESYLDRYEAVSYTHLDVYKRQTWPRRTGGASTTT